MERARPTHGRSVAVEQPIGVNGWVEIGMVQDVEELRPKLNVKVLRNPGNVVVLKYRKIKIE
jgi:hypothetical protein